MYRITNDQRTKRSGQLIYEALAELIYDKPFSKISVSNIVEKAQVGRTTFYRCFDSIEDILRMRCDQVFDELLAYILNYRRQADNSVDVGPHLKPLLRYFYLNSDIIELLLQANRMDILLGSFRARSKPLTAMAAQQLQLEENYAAYGVEMRLGVLVAILSNWVKTGKREAPDELADRLKGMIKKMITVDQLL